MITLTACLVSIAKGACNRLGYEVLPCIKNLVFLFNETRVFMNTLKALEATIKDLDQQHKLSNSDEDWLQKLRPVLRDAEELADDFVTKVSRPQGTTQTNVVGEVQNWFSNLPLSIEMAFRMKSIRDKLDKMSEDRNRFRQNVILKVGDERREETHGFPPPDAVGRKEDKSKIKELLKDCSGERNVSVIAITGIGGIGKTTLAQLVFDDKDEDRTIFKPKMWVCVSNSFDLENTIKKILSEATGKECPNLSLHTLVSMLQEKLNNMTYLLVIDDLWNENSEEWIKLENLLMGGLRGSKILVTTRIKDIGSVITGASVYRLGGLSKDDSWDLFEQLPSNQEKMKNNPHLLKIGQEIVDRCERVPSAIRTAAKLLSSENSYKGWLKVKNQLWELSEEPSDVMPISRISYHRLPFHLKQCFAYCSLFPRDCEIKKASLIAMWIAQGFVWRSSNDPRPLDDIGDDYFSSLRRYFFQDEKRDASGNIISCKMHGIHHDLAASVAGVEYSFVKNNSPVRITEAIIHVSLDPTVSYSQQLRTSLLQATELRTFLGPGLYKTSKEVLDYGNLVSKFKKLRVLDLGVVMSSSSTSIPESELARFQMSLRDMLDSVSKLNRLSYLDLSGTCIKELPRSIGKLQNLYMLKLNGCSYLEGLPTDIQKLRNLTHLENNECRKLTQMPSGLGQLTSIQTLPLFVVGNNGGGLNELEGLNKLSGELTITGLANARNAVLETDQSFLTRKEDLLVLRLTWNKNQSMGDIVLGVNKDAVLLKHFEPHQSLRELHIGGYEDITFPDWLCKISETLPNLTVINLDGCSGCQRLPLTGQFPHLKILKLVDLNALEYIESNVDNSSTSSASSAAAASSSSSSAAAAAAAAAPAALSSSSSSSSSASASSSSSSSSFASASASLSSSYSTSSSSSASASSSSSSAAAASSSASSSSSSSSASASSSSSSSSSSSLRGNLMTRAERWFPCLIELHLEKLPKLKQWGTTEVEGGEVRKSTSPEEQQRSLLSLDNLVKLTILACPSLTSMPSIPDIEDPVLDGDSKTLLKKMKIKHQKQPAVH